MTWKYSGYSIQEIVTFCLIWKTEFRKLFSNTPLVIMNKFLFYAVFIFLRSHIESLKYPKLNIFVFVLHFRSKSNWNVFVCTKNRISLSSIKTELQCSLTQNGTQCISIFHENIVSSMYSEIIVNWLIIIWFEINDIDY